MPSIPLTADEEKKALSVLGLRSIEDLFATIPPKIRERSGLKLDFGENIDSQHGLSEHDIRLYFAKLAGKNAVFPEYRHFLGGGFYDNIIPSIVSQLVLRGEFLTCYTPYQPEISQGTLQAIFEFQTMISRITAMPVANASMYDGPTAIAEAVLMAQRLSAQKKGNVTMALSVTPDTEQVVTTFLRGHAEKPVIIPWTSAGTIDCDALKTILSTKSPCAVVVPYPNYFGVIEPLKEIKALLPSNCLLIAAVSDPSALSIFEAPGNLGADIVAGEAHQFGTPLSMGGPHLGFLATRKEFIRQMPGRLCGETTDARGNRAYTLTLSTREQHIRREKATSNICTNQGLIALRATIYLSFLGKSGFVELGETNYSLFEYLKEELGSVGIPLKFKSDMYYREGVFDIPNLKQRFSNALSKKIIPGIELAKKFPALSSEFSDSLLISVHPKLRKEDIDDLIEVLSHD